MLHRLDLDMFKCFKKLRLPLGNLTLLSGINASGKSSVLQSLVLLHQTLQENEWSTRLTLNGDIVRLGTVTDVVDQENGRNSFDICLAGEDVSCLWSFSGERSDMSMELERIVADGMEFEPPFMLKNLLPHSVESYTVGQMVNAIKRLNYITAEREGPRDVYPLEDRYALMRERTEWATSDILNHQQLFFFKSRASGRKRN